MSTKVKIKIGSVEVEFEGSEEFLKSELIKLATSVSELSKESGMVTPPGKIESSNQEKGKIAPEKTKIQWSIGYMASKLNCNTCSCLIKAACAHITFVAKQPSFTRKEIHDQMKKAKNHYKVNYSKNLSYYLKTLLDNDELNESVSNTYALTQKCRKELETQLGI